MQVKQKPLAERIQKVSSDYCAHDEYVEAIIRQFAEQNITDYMQQHEQEMCSIQFLLSLSSDELEKMTYQQLSKVIDDMLFETPSCGDGYLYEAIDHLIQPLLSEKQTKTAQNEPKMQKIPLAQRLKSVKPPKEQLMCGMTVEGMLCYMDCLLGVDKFTRCYMQHFLHYGAETICELLKHSEQMPYEERCRIRHRLMIEPFADLERNDNPENEEIL